jgi:chemotaxis family two-component system response regulator Rcp1
MLSLPSQTPIEILLVEDNPADVRLTREALAECRIPCHLNVAYDGVEALDFLHRKGENADSPRPHLILLDLNLPRKDGREVLREVKSDQDLRRIPVIVLSTSRALRDLQTSYDLHANCYIAKPNDLDEFFRVVCSLEDFWLGVAQLPGR